MRDLRQLLNKTKGRESIFDRLKKPAQRPAEESKDSPDESEPRERRSVLDRIKIKKDKGDEREEQR